MIFKTTPLTADFYPLRRQCKGTRAFELEVHHYNSQCEKLQPLPAPASYFAAHEPESAKFALLLEDLGARTQDGSQAKLLSPGDQVAGLRENQVEAAHVAVSAAAELHAKHFDRTRANGCGAWAKALDSPSNVADFPLAYGAAWPELLQRCETAGIAIDEDVVAFGNRLGLDVADQMRFCGSTAEEGDFMHQTVTHADFRLDNLFFGFERDGSLRRDADGRPIWCATDFQQVAMTNPMFELAYFISQSVSPAFRRKFERTLLETYYKSLIGAGVLQEAFPWEVMLFHYQVAQAMAFYYAVFVGHASVGNGERGRQLTEAVLARWVDAFRDWGVADAFEYTMRRFAENRKGPLTTRECQEILPSSKRCVACRRVPYIFHIMHTCLNTPHTPEHPPHPTP
jgi:hypothetical protein